MQIALGRIRRASGHYRGELLALAPHHHMLSHTNRQTRRHKHNAGDKAVKTVQTVFCIDAQTRAPLCCSRGSSSRTATQATFPLLRMAEQILGARRAADSATLVVPDGEHYTRAILRDARADTPFDLTAPVPETAGSQRIMRNVPQEQFTCHWPGFATTRIPYSMSGSEKKAPPSCLMIQRQGERETD